MHLLHCDISVWNLWRKTGFSKIHSLESKTPVNILWCNTKIQQLIVFKRLVAVWNLKLKFIDLSCTLSVFYPWIFSFRIGHLENTGSLSYKDFPDGLYISLYNIWKLYLLISPSIFIRKAALALWISWKYLGTPLLPGFHRSHFGNYNAKLVWQPTNR